MISRTNAVLAALLALVLVMTLITRVDYSKPNIEVLPDMKYTPAWTAFAENSNFSNGRTMQAPVPGTIARGSMPLHYLATKEDAIRAGEELQNPFASGQVEDATTTIDPTDAAAENPAANLDIAESGPAEAQEAEDAKRRTSAQSRRTASIARGSDTYRVYCVACHGPKGLGDGRVTQRGFPPPPSLLTGKSPQMKDGQLFHILSYGQGSMASFAAQLSHQQRWDVINYVRELQGSVSTNESGITAPQPPNGATTGDATTKDAP